VRILTRLVAVAAAVETILAAPAVHADADAIDGGCFVMVVDLNSVTNFATSGLLADVSMTRDGNGAPIPATVTCWIQVNGVEAAGTRFTSGGPGVQAGAEQVSFVLDETDAVTVCERVAYADGAATTTCTPSPSELDVPPQLLPDVIHEVFATVLDPQTCPVLAGNAGIYPGGLVISSTGDVVVTDAVDMTGSITVYDCPPYRSETTPALVVVGPVRT
jgi:hypothetical protein